MELVGPAEYTGYSDEVIWRWARALFFDYLGSLSNSDNADDAAISAELETNRGEILK